MNTPMKIPTVKVGKEVSSDSDSVSHENLSPHEESTRKALRRIVRDSVIDFKKVSVDMGFVKARQYLKTIDVQQQLKKISTMDHEAGII